MKRLFLTILAITSLASLSAKDAVFSGEDYSLVVNYQDVVDQGDAVFVRMTMSRTKKPVAGTPTGETTARLTLNKDVSTDFFPVTPKSGKNANGITLLAALGFSTWQKVGDYTLTVLYTPFGEPPMTFELPMTIQKKSFVSETIELNAANTAISTDTSPKRTAQIDKLNKILFAKNKGAVYQQGAFKSPTEATRRTSFFGDRRVYAYSNGKSSTTEHYGIDYGVPTGTLVSACAAGKVVMAEDRISTGWSVVIEHLPGLYSLYYHMDSLSVSEGDTVKQGAKLGVSGATGLATGPHLHWEMRLGGVAVNPDFFTTDFSFYDKAN